ncbi:unnamed protein product [Linum tenue]|uniref:Uncharacterized protein n=1 Tax=Linum tenue TaxID=586396 RepID=A0AAV0K8V0_9ROSI|nr:unnamed protein product [Linum tenue]
MAKILESSPHTTRRQTLSRLLFFQFLWKCIRSISIPG